MVATNLYLEHVFFSLVGVANLSFITRWTTNPGERKFDLPLSSGLWMRPVVYSGCGLRKAEISVNKTFRLL